MCESDARVPEGRYTTEPLKFLIAGRCIVLLTGDITREATDAIVNAANSSLMGGGGVDGAIHRVGGPAIIAECKKYREFNPPLRPGRAVATTGGLLPTRHIIHTVGPVWRGGSEGEPDVLASCYRESLRVADDLKVTSIAFPAISTGAFGYPIDLAAAAAVRTVTDFLPTLQYVREVRFVLFEERTLAVYKEAVAVVTQH